MHVLLWRAYNVYKHGLQSQNVWVNNPGSPLYQQWSEANYLTSVCLSFLIYKMRLIITPHCIIVKVTWVNICNVIKTPHLYKCYMVLAEILSLRGKSWHIVIHPVKFWPRSLKMLKEYLNLMWVTKNSIHFTVIRRYLILFVDLILHIVM